MVRLRTVEAGVLLGVMELEAKLQVAPTGAEPQVSEIAAPKTPCPGVTDTVYMAVLPAVTVSLVGFTLTEKLWATNGTVVVSLPVLGSVLLNEDTLTSAEYEVA